MSRALGRFLRVLGLDLALHLRRPMFWVWIALLALFAWGFSAGGVQIQAGDSQVGGQKALITSQFAVAQQVAILGLMIYGFFTAVIAGMSLVQDHELRVVDLLGSTSLRPREYVWGKFLAALAACAVVAGLHLGLMLVFNHAMPGGADTAELRGPLRLINYLRPMLLFLVPVVVFLAGVSFGLGEWSRSAILVFVLPVALLLACGFFLWSWSPDWLTPGWNSVLMHLDPTGFRWLKETWLDVDRGVQFYNGASIPIDAAFVASRLAFVLIGLLGVYGAERHLARSLRGARAPKNAAEALTRAREARPVTLTETPIDRPLAGLGMTARRPGLLAGAWRVARVELRELWSSPGLYIFVPLILLQTIGMSLSAVGAFDTPLLSTPGSLAVSAMGPLTVMVCLLLLFYTTESLLRERTVRLDAIAYATPVRTASLLIGKVVAGATVGTVILLAALVADAIVLLVQGKVAFEWRPFALVWGLLLVPTFLAWSAFVAAVLALTRNRYATYAIGLGVLAFSGYRFLRGQMNWVGNWPLWSAVRWSDLSILEFDRLALILNRGWVLSLGLVFTALTGLWFSRRERDPAGIAHRLRPWNLFRTALKLSPVLVPAIGLGVGLWVLVERGSNGGTVRQRQRNYWKANLATWKDAPQPGLLDVTMDLTLDPQRSAFAAQGTYRLINRTDKPMRALPITVGTHWTDLSWTLDGQTITPQDRSGLVIIVPPEPLAPGAETTLGFAYKGMFPSGISENGGGAGEFILPSGVVLTSFGTSFAPVLGYVEGVGVEKDKNDYEAKRYERDFHLGKTEPGFGSGELMTTKLTITAPGNLTVNSVGQKLSETEQGGQRTVVWQSDEPVHFFNVVAGRWAEKRGNGTVVYYHPGHSYNVETLSTALDAARQYYGEWFHPYPWGELKLSEFPGLAGYAQGFPTNITFSEGIGFLTNSGDEAEAPFLVAAHEAAHQWWGNLLLPGKGPGGNILSEGLAHYSTGLLMEQVRGPQARLEFFKRIEKQYTKARNADEERPLYETDGSLPTDSTVTYNRGGWVFWMLQQHLGREAMLQGLQAFIRQYRVTDDFPVLQDLVASLRPFAADPAVYDTFVDEWIGGRVLPEFRVSGARVQKTGEGTWRVVATVENAGTGRVTVSVATEAGERFDKNGTPNESYQVQSTAITLDAGQSQEVQIDCTFAPDHFTVDPDVQVLQLLRERARVAL